MFKASPPLILTICIIATVSIALGKYIYPQLIYSNSGLLLVILLTILIKKDTSTIIFGAVAVFIILASLLHKIEGPGHQELIQQLMASATAVITIFVVLHIKKLYRSIEAERTQMNALFEFANEGIIVTNAIGEIVLVNPAARKLFMYEENELLGENIEIVIAESFHSLHKQHKMSFHKNPSNRSMGYGMDIFAVKKSGAQFPVEVSLSFYQQNNESFVLAFIIDISRRKQAEMQLLTQKGQLEKVTQDMHKMNVELEIKVAERTLIMQEALHELEKSQLELSEALNKEKELNEIKSRFVSMTSHEFRTPLSTVMSSASLISKYQHTDEQHKRDKHIFRIKDSVKHLNDLLQDFLNLGILEEGRVSTQVVEFNVNEFMIDTLDEMKNGLKQGQQFKLCFEGEPHFVTDRRLLKNVLINLLSNAIKFSGDNKCISVSILNSVSWLIVQVKDEGIGIASEDLPRLFSTFYRGRNAVNIQGTGLGLALVKRYIDLLKGKMTLSTHLHEGTVINIGLPNLSV